MPSASGEVPTLNKNQDNDRGGSGRVVDSGDDSVQKVDSEKSIVGAASKKYDYNGKSQCRNKGKYEGFPKCKARLEDCRYYDRIKNSDGKWVEICKLRYKSEKERKKQDKAADLGKITRIATYIRRS